MSGSDSPTVGWAVGGRPGQLAKYVCPVHKTAADVHAIRLDRARAERLCCGQCGEQLARRSVVIRTGGRYAT